jgi:hypothetical protein
VIAGTTKGSGGYRLTFELTPAAAPSSAQLQPMDDTGRTLTTGGTVKPIAFFFDPEGRPMSGARVQWMKTPEAGDTASISFPSDGLAPTSPRGFSQVTGTVTSLGTVGFGPSLLDAGVRSGATAPAGALRIEGTDDATSPEATAVASLLSIPTPPIHAHIGIRLGTIDPWSGTMELAMDKPERAEILHAQPERVLRGGEASAREQEAMTAGGSPQAQSRRPQTPTRLSSARGRVAALEAPSCAAPSFRALSVNGTVQGPFTLTLTDLTPKTGESSGSEEVGPEGIRGHRVDKTIELKIAITDGTGFEPTYPILVHLQVSGPAAGLLALGRPSPPAAPSPSSGTSGTRRETSSPPTTPSATGSGRRRASRASCRTPRDPWG